VVFIGTVGFQYILSVLSQKTLQNAYLLWR